MRTFVGFVQLTAALLAVSWLWASPAAAGFAPRLLVVRGPDVPASVRSDATEALSSVGEPVDSGEYLQAARDQGLPPTSEDALQTLGPAQYVTMIVVIEGTGAGQLHLTYREGHGGTPVLQQEVAYRGKHLSAQAQAQISEAAQQALDQVRGKPSVRAPAAAPAPAPSSPSRFSSGRFGRPAAQPEPVPPQEEPMPMAPAAAPEPGFGAESSAAPEAAAMAETGAPSENRPLDAGLDLGLGIGTRDVRLPSSAGDRTFNGGPFPSFAIAVHAESALSDHVLFGARVRYDSSLGLVAHEKPANGAMKDTSVRASRVELGVTPGLRFTKSKDSVVLGAFVGWGIRGLRPVIDLSIPGYMLHGPMLRAELRIPIASGKVVLRLAPELHGLVYVSGALQTVGDAGSGGLAVGAEASLRIAASELMGIEFAYRESHASVATAWGVPLTDVERFASLAAVVQY